MSFNLKLNELEALDSVMNMESDTRDTFRSLMNSCTEDMFELNSSTFHKNPTEYYQILRDVENTYLSKEGQKYLTFILNDTRSFFTWNSPPLHWVIYATGDLPEVARNYHRYDCFGATGFLFDETTNLNENDAIHLFELMINLGADVKVKNGFGEDIKALYERIIDKDIDTKKQGIVLHRENNHRFLSYLRGVIRDEF